MKQSNHETMKQFNNNNRSKIGIKLERIYIVMSFKMAFKKITNIKSIVIPHLEAESVEF